MVKTIITDNNVIAIHVVCTMPICFGPKIVNLAATSFKKLIAAIKRPTPTKIEEIHFSSTTRVVL